MNPHCCFVACEVDRCIHEKNYDFISRFQSLTLALMGRFFQLKSMLDCAVMTEPIPSPATKPVASVIHEVSIRLPCYQRNGIGANRALHVFRRPRGPLQSCD